MRGKHKYREVQRKRIIEEEEQEEGKRKREEKKEERQKSEEKAEEKEGEKEIPVLDITLERKVLAPKYKNLDTTVREINPKQQYKVSNVLDIMLTKSKIKQYEIPDTEVIPVEPKIQKREIKIFDPVLSSSKIKPYPVELDTSVPNQMLGQRKYKKKNFEIFDPILNETSHNLKIIENLDTEVIAVIPKTVLESMAMHSATKTNYLLEELINLEQKKGRFPRSFSESQNAPIVVLIGEGKYEWHNPIIYVLKQLFREITERHPRITFRELEDYAEGIEEKIDTLDPHSLEQFSLEHKIEFLDSRKYSFPVGDFVKTVDGRLKSGFLQQFGVLVIAVRPENFDTAKNALNFEGLRVYPCNPEVSEDDKKIKKRYITFVSELTGVNSDKFFTGMERYEKALEITTRKFSVFVKRGMDSRDEQHSDRYQYPLKVAAFVYLVNQLFQKQIIDMRKEDVENELKRWRENPYKVIQKLIVNKKKDGEDGRIIKVEEIAESKSPSGKEVIPDITYTNDGEEIYIEIETLIGTLEPLKKIDETVEKYHDILTGENNDRKVWVVLKPVSALLHYEELKEREKAYKVMYSLQETEKGKKERKILFKVLTLSTRDTKDTALVFRFKWELVDLDDFAKDAISFRKILKEDSKKDNGGDVNGQ